MNNVSAIIAVKDYPPHIFETIASVKNLANEIIILDIGISENLKGKIESDKSIKIIKIDKKITHVELIREESKQFAHNEYILFVDPDEVLPDKLITVLKTNLNKYDYFAIPRKNIIFNKWIKYSRWWPDYQIRLFKKNSVIWPREIHKQPQTTGKSLSIEAKEALALTHYNYETLDEYFVKMIRYAKVEAGELNNKNKDLTLNDTIKKSLSEFVSRYFASQGYKDGTHGLVLSFLQMIYCFIVYFYYWESKKYNEKENDKDPLKIRDYFYGGLKEVNYWMIQSKIVKGTKRLKLKIENLLLKILH